MGESETPGEGGACGGGGGGGRDDMDCLPGRDIVLMASRPGCLGGSEGFWAFFGAGGFAHIAPLGFQGGECSCGGCV